MGLDEVAADGSPGLIPLDELQKELTGLENGSFTSLSDDELQKKIGNIQKGFIFQAPTFPIGTVIYRAVRVSQRPTHQSRVSYPAVEFANHTDDSIALAT
ncbi:MAG TPA: hypothetical protein VK829_06125 [Terriglobales bacterium]|jgi:hypothetical protein|nr:hypothetical protein [Terriglobales bacterium]